YPEAKVTQIFDVKKDPWETRNLANDARYRPLKGHLLDRLHRFQRDLEDDLPPVSAGNPA
ncbi:MAG: sulfatase, partial [Acidobacteriota bacterium]|nr:sulfatase [Acidobacteriota bacterium]